MYLQMNETPSYLCWILTHFPHPNEFERLTYKQQEDKLRKGVYRIFQKYGKKKKCSEELIHEIFHNLFHYGYLHNVQGNHQWCDIFEYILVSTNYSIIILIY